MNKNKFYSINIYLLSAYCVTGNINSWSLYYIPVLLRHSTNRHGSPIYTLPCLYPNYKTPTHAHMHTQVCMGPIDHRMEVLRASVSTACASNTILILCRRHCHFHTCEAPSISGISSAFEYNEKSN